MRRTLLALLGLAAILLIPATPAHAATWGGKWAQPVVTIYDATGGGYEVADLPGEWSVPGLTLTMAADEASADIVVRAELVCGSGLSCYAGYYNATLSGSTITHCDVRVDPGIRGTILGEHSAAHEVGHCLGLEHNATDVKRSVMNASVNWSTAQSRPSSFDRRNLRSLYG